jgi:hypothetical protein
MSRAAWLALGATTAAAACVALSSCSSSPQPGTTAESVQGDAGARFACADASCLVGQEVCWSETDCYGGTTTQRCAALDASAYTSSCAADPTCSGCIGRNVADAKPPYVDPSYGCMDRDGGGVDLYEDINCVGCYGAPPARLERLASA